jgi:hypothetical protein
LTGRRDDDGHDATDQQHTQPQDAFAELAKISLADHTLERVMEKIAELAKRTLQLKGEVSVTIVDRGKPSTVAHTGQLALDLDERQYQRGYGPCMDCIDGGQPLVVEDMSAEKRSTSWSGSPRRRTASFVTSPRHWSPTRWETAMTAPDLQRRVDRRVADADRVLARARHGRGKPGTPRRHP